MQLGVRLVGLYYCRAFLKAVYLHGETQQKMRILELFAERYRRQNPNVFTSTDACFRLAVAVVLLNTDLYIHKGDAKLTLKDWAGMLAAATEDRGAYDPALVKALYASIRARPLELPDSEIELLDAMVDQGPPGAERRTLQGLLGATRRRGSTFSLGGKSLSSLSVTSRRSSIRSLASDLVWHAAWSSIRGSTGSERQEALLTLTIMCLPCARS
jgi:hypothetical protein